MVQAPIVILGAGLTGLSTAYHLEQQGFFDYLLFEKDSTAGGLCRSITQDGFTFDYTGHLIHASDPYFRKFIDATIGIANLATISRRSFIYSHDTYTRYPYQINLYGLPNDIIEECITGFVKRKTSRTTLNFKQWVLAHFGKGIAEHFFFPFQRKIFDYPLEKVTTDWMGRFVPSTSLLEMVKGSCPPSHQESIGYNAHFYYPHSGGINAWMQAITDNLINPVLTDYEVIKIDTPSKRVYFANGHEQAYSQLITTIPLDILIKRLEEKSSTNLHHALGNLVCNSVLNFNLGISRDTISSKHWIYFPEKKYPFYRLGFPHNFTPHAVPSGCSSLYGEISYITTTKATLHRTLQNAYRIVEQLLAVRPEEIVTKALITIPHAYVIYTQWRKHNLATLLERLQEYDIYSIGRYGGWKYSSMQEAVLDGKKMAEDVLTPSLIPHALKVTSPYMTA